MATGVVEDWGGLFYAFPHYPEEGFISRQTVDVIHSKKRPTLAGEHCSEIYAIDFISTGARVSQNINYFVHLTKECRTQSQRFTVTFILSQTLFQIFNKLD